MSNLLRELSLNSLRVRKNSMDLLSLQYLPCLKGSLLGLAEAELDSSLLRTLGTTVLVFNAGCGTNQVLETQMESHGSS